MSLTVKDRTVRDCHTKLQEASDNNSIPLKGAKILLNWHEA